jgi:hypothetical protein
MGGPSQYPLLRTVIEQLYRKDRLYQGIDRASAAVAFVPKRSAMPSNAAAKPEYGCCLDVMNMRSADCYRFIHYISQLNFDQLAK